MRPPWDLSLLPSSPSHHHGWKWNPWGPGSRCVTCSPNLVIFHWTMIFMGWRGYGVKRVQFLSRKIFQLSSGIKFSAFNRSWWLYRFTRLKNKQKKSLWRSRRRFRFLVYLLYMAGLRKNPGSKWENHLSMILTKGTLWTFISPLLTVFGQGPRQAHRTLCKHDLRSSTQS